MWTMEQETNLFKAITRFKPAGPHKHFRMISIRRMVNGSSGAEVSAKQIWTKLGTLYNLSGLDELEDTGSGLSSLRSASPTSRALDSESTELGTEFSLPWNEYGELMILQAQAGPLSEEEEEEEGEKEEKEEEEKEEEKEDLKKKDVKKEEINGEAQEPEVGKEENQQEECEEKPEVSVRTTRASSRSTRLRAAAKPSTEKEKQKEKDTEVEREENGEKEEESAPRASARVKRKAPPAPAAKAATPRRSSRRR